MLVLAMPAAAIYRLRSFSTLKQREIHARDCKELEIDVKI